MEDVTDSKTLLNEFGKQLLKRGKTVREIKDCFIDVGQEDDWHRTDYAKLWSTVYIIQRDTKLLSVANGYVFSFPHLSPFVEGVIAYSIDFPMKHDIINKLNNNLGRMLDKNKLSINPKIQDLNKTDIENLFNYDLQWYGAGIKRAGELIKVEGYNGETRETPMPAEFQILLQPEKIYPNKYAYIASHYVADDKDNSKSFYKSKETLEHLDSWLTKKLD